MASLVKITVRFNEDEELALKSCAKSMGIVDRNGKPKISTFIKLAIKSNQFYKNRINFINKYTEKR